MTKPVVTRFAPSPTGFLHIGGARTALFNWLFAKHTGGKFLLRIEDTDRERSTEAATKAIVDGLQWLELCWDGEIVHQFARAQRHAEVARDLLAQGKAYNCYLSPAELDEMRKRSEAAKSSVPVRSPWRDRDPQEAPPDVKPVIRLRAPSDGQTVVDDAVLGPVVLQNATLDDFIILRSDGTPIYNLAVTVDDHDMGVSHVIRGVEHLTNAARQMLIYQAMGWDVPVFAHLPLIHGADGAKLSKRHGAQGVEEYRAMGYIPAGLRNYLARLGWSHGDDEIFTTDQAIEWFDVKDVGKSPARFDFAKLADVNGHHIRSIDNAELLRRIRDYLPHGKGGEADVAAFASLGWDRLALALPSLKERAKILPELVDGARYLIAKRPLVLDDKASKLLDANARVGLAKVAQKLAQLTDWSTANLELAIRELADAEGLKLGQLAQPLRAALTGRSVSPPVFDVMAVLGREEALARIKDLAVS